MSEERIDDPNLWKKKGDDYFDDGKYEEAIKYYSEAIDLDPTFSAAWNNLGFAYFKLGRIEEAKKCKNMIKSLREDADRSRSEKDIDQKIDAKSEGEVPQPKPAEGKSFINRIPGFRSATPWKMILAVIGYGFIILIILGMIGNALSPQQASGSSHDGSTFNEAVPTPQYTLQGTPPPKQTPSTQSVDQLKSTATIVSYEELFRNYRHYVGDTVYFRGQIIQGFSPYPGTYVYRITTGNYGDVLYVNAQSPFLVYDEVDLWGKVKGMKTYESVLGNSITIPEIDALHIELVNNPTPTITRTQTTFAQTPIVTPAPMTRYYNSKFKFSMNYPQNWFKSEVDNSYYNYKTTSIDFTSATRDPRATVTVDATNTDYGSVEQFFTKAFAEIDRNYDLTITKHQSQMNIDGERAYRVDYYIKDENAQISTKVVQVFVSYDGYYYIITYSAPWPRGNEQNLYDSYLTMAQDMINSIRFI